MTMKVKIQLCFTLLFLMQIPLNVQAENNEQLVQNLIKLRGEVEDLQSELKILKSEHKNSMSYLNTRKTELYANVDRKKLHIKKAQSELIKLQDKIKLLGAGSEQLQPNVMSLLVIVKASLNTGIPFKQTERLSVIEEIERKLVSKKITSQNAINRIWAFLEDEIRLTRENAVYSQTIKLNGENRLVEIAKLGTVMMYFKTRENQYGIAEKHGVNWTYRLYTNTKKTQQVAILFDSLKKQIRQGYFNLPLTITVSE